MEITILLIPTRFITPETRAQIIATGIAGRQFEINFVGDLGDTKIFKFTINDLGLSILESDPTIWKDNSYTLGEVIELNSQGLPDYKIQTENTSTRPENLTIHVFRGDVRPYALNATEVILDSAFGANCEFCRLSFGNPKSRLQLYYNYGLIETGRTKIIESASTVTAVERYPATAVTAEVLIITTNRN